MCIAIAKPRYHKSYIQMLNGQSVRFKSSLLSEWPSIEWPIFVIVLQDEAPGDTGKSPQGNQDACPSRPP